MADTNPQDTTITNPQVVQKYREAGNIASEVLLKVISLCVPGARVIDICSEGDKAIREATKSIYSKQKITKGVGFPTTVSLNNCVAHMSPLTSDPNAETTLKDGDVAKIQLGVQIDGYCSTVAHTLEVGVSAEKPSTGRKADVIQAAYTALQAAVRLIRPDNRNMDVTSMVAKVAEAYDTKPVEGMLSHQQLRNNTTGDKQIILNPSQGQLHDFKPIKFAKNEVYAVDIIVSTGKGKVHSLDTRTTIYQRTEVRYNLKLEKSRTTLAELVKKGGSFPISIRDMDDERNARLGVMEAAKFKCLLPYDVVFESEDAVVAQFLTTILVTDAGNIIVTKPPFDESSIKSDKTVQDQDILELLEKDVEVVSKKKAKKPTQ